MLRASVMGAITLLAVLSYRHRQAIPALSASVLVLMIGSPESAVDVGFALPVSATAASRRDRAAVLCLLAWTVSGLSAGRDTIVG
nr:ComEC/Rec2-like protein [Mycolicibacterium komanii]